MSYSWLVKDLRTKAAMIRVGEAIAPFSECDLMEEAAKVIEADDEVNRIMLLTDEQVMAECDPIAIGIARDRASITEGWDRWYEALPADLRRKLALHDFKRLGEAFRGAFGIPSAAGDA